MPEPITRSRKANSPIYFLTQDPDLFATWLNNDATPPSVEEAYSFDLTRTANFSWCTTTWIRLRQRGWNVRLSREFIPGHICITSYEALNLPGDPRASFVVTCQHDRARVGLGELVVVQNKKMVRDKRTTYIPHWPHPAIVSRELSRQSLLTRVQYNGRIENLASRYRNVQFRNQLKSMGIEFDTGPIDRQTKRESWNNYKTADIVLSVRDTPKVNIASKPASKLVNAWHAGVPCLLGEEPAYQELRQSQLDYIEVSSPQQAITALNFLKNRPDIYQAMVRNGRERSIEFSNNAITTTWENFLENRVLPEFSFWQTRNKGLRATVSQRWRTARHSASKRVFNARGGDGSAPFWKIGVDSS